MTTADELARGIIERAFSTQPDGTDVSGVRLLRLFADASSHFIGELGFATMLFRCAQGSVVEFPWIPTDARVERGTGQVVKMDCVIDGQDPAEARRELIHLFNCFVDFLTLMIGEGATLLIFHQAFDRLIGAPDIVPE